MKKFTSIAALFLIGSILVQGDCSNDISVWGLIDSAGACSFYNSDGTLKDPPPTTATSCTVVICYTDNIYCAGPVSGASCVQAVYDTEGFLVELETFVGTCTGGIVTSSFCDTSASVGVECEEIVHTAYDTEDCVILAQGFPRQASRSFIATFMSLF